MIRHCYEHESETIHSIINESAFVYEGVIPDDCWKEPYMSTAEFLYELDAGVKFWGYEVDERLVGVMGIQQVQDVTLIRHAYVRPAWQNQGFGGDLLSFLRRQVTSPILIGTWADAVLAINFYKKHRFKLVSPVEKDRLLRKYWSISDRQIETSVVLADQHWFDIHQPGVGRT